jgi:hypothetical protein
METLQEVYQRQVSKGSKCDKGTTHDYLQGYYQASFKGRFEPKRMLELGINFGHSLLLWKEWFPSTSIYGIDIRDVMDCKYQLEGVTCLIADGFSERTLEMFPDNHFDIIIDDGPHTLSTNSFSATRWVNKLTVGGKLVIEDIQKFEWVAEIKGQVDLSKFNFRCIDLRLNKGRYDDIIIEIIKK